jgi:hypothetical protein
MTEIVLVRAACGKPLVRHVILVQEKHIYLSREDLVGKVLLGHENAVAFPKSDIFQYDEEIYTRLHNLWPCTESKTDAVWSLCTPFSC